MSGREEVLFGNIAVQWGWLSKEMLQRALAFQQAKAPDRRLGEILVGYKLLTQQQVQEIHAYQERIRRLRQQTASARHLQQRATGAPTPPSGWSPPGGPGAALDPGGGGGAAVAVALGPTPNPDQDPLLGEVIGGCSINARIGAGAMAAVYLAHQESLRKDVVVKVLSQELSSKERTVERFFREARAAARLEHPNIVSVYDVGSTEVGLHYMVMQYVDGVNLEEKVQTDGRLSPSEATRIVLEVARALEVAHAEDVIHRDIKADNILITATGQVKVTDFGLAKDLNLDPLTMEGAFVGTPLYMAPEIGREQVDGRADIYSLGLTFYYLLTGVQPFKAFSAMEILRAQAHERIAPPEEHFPDLPSDHRSVLGRMLEKERGRRYADARALIRDLEALDRGLPVEAGPSCLWDGVEDEARPQEASRPTRPPPVARLEPASGEELTPGLVAALAVAVLVVVSLLIVLLLVLF